ncbi:MAG: SOS response-associated peptidase, partial [Pseudomonadota bacterium]|nr:SOS response-associated peptidase [Pseudomonadota bacterium]
IVTTDCNALMQPIHDRMPVILQEDAWDTWLTPTALPDTMLLPLLKPFTPDQMQLWAVSSAVGKVANQGPELIRPVL